MEDLISKLPDHAKNIIAEMKQMMAAGLGTTSGYHGTGWKGYRFSLFFLSDTAKKIYEDFEFPQNTVMLASFPKTGTNWLAQIVREMLYGFDDEVKKLVDIVPPPMFVLEGWKGTAVDTSVVEIKSDLDRNSFTAEKHELWKYIPLPRHFFMSHLPAPMVNFEKVKKSNTKIIIPIRNPKDQAISWFHFSQGANFAPIAEYINPDWSQFFLDYIQGKQPIPLTKPGEGYAEFLKGWWELKDEPNVLFIHFEDMKKQPEKMIRRMADFLNVDLTDEQVRIVVERTSFDAMKKNQQAASDEVSQIRKHLNLLRKGKVGSWKDTFTVAQSEMMDEMMSEKLSGTGIEFTYT